MFFFCLFQMIVSVLLAATLLQLVSSRGLPVDEMDNEISVNPIGNLQFDTPKDWVHISTPPLLVQSKKFGSHVELGCEAMGSPAPTIQWYKGNLQVTAVSFTKRKVKTYFMEKNVNIYINDQF